MDTVTSAWGSATESLPTLEPTSLYALALVQLAFGSGKVAGPPPLTSTDAVPTLYADTTAATPAQIRDYCAAHSKLDALDERALARGVAIHTLLDDRVRDLVLHSLFSLPRNFEKIAPLLAPRTTPPSSLPRRLRNAVRARLESPHIGLWGAGGSWARAEAAEAQRWNAGAGLAPEATGGLAAYTPGILRHHTRASDVREEWERSRLVSDARELYRMLDAFLGTPYLLGDAPSSADAHMYALLAPLLRGPELPVALLPNLLRTEFARLVDHNDRMHALLWSDARWAFERTANPAQSAMPSVSELVADAWRGLWTRKPKAAPPAPLSLRIGRALWIAAAIIGPIAWIFATGIVTIEYVDEDDYGEAAEAGEDEGEEDEEGEVDEEGDEGDEGDEEALFDDIAAENAAAALGSMDEDMDD